MDNPVDSTFVDLINLAFKQKHVGKPKVCTFCGGTEFSISEEGFIRLPLFNPFLKKNNNELLTVFVGCQNCGHLDFFSAYNLGLELELKKIKPK